VIVYYRGPVFIHLSIAYSLEFFVSSYCIWCWSFDIPISTQVSILGISRKSLVDWMNFCRDMCLDYLTANNPRIGGLDHVVEIGESVICRRKYHHGRMIPTRWMFDGYDRITKFGFVVQVPYRSARILLPLIRKYIRPGSIIISDEWRAYRGIPKIQCNPRLLHRTVNHSPTFVHPVHSFIHTQSIESMWTKIKRKFKRMHGTVESLMNSYLAEFMWRQRFGKCGTPNFHALIAQIVQKYVV
jgi:transposase-like protein